jgi:protein gp37
MVRYWSVGRPIDCMAKEPCDAAANHLPLNLTAHLQRMHASTEAGLTRSAHGTTEYLGHVMKPATSFITAYPWTVSAPQEIPW